MHGEHNILGTRPQNGQRRALITSRNRIASLSECAFLKRGNKKTRWLKRKERSTLLKTRTSKAFMNCGEISSEVTSQ